MSKGLLMSSSLVKGARERHRVSAAERNYLLYGLDQPGGKLPLFDDSGQKINPGVVKACIDKGLAERWFSNPMHPNWLVCKLTDAGRDAANSRP